MNKEQQEVFDAICAYKKNVFVTGGAGVGKSHLIKLIKRELGGPKARFTAATGIAASHFGGCTFHSALGIGMGKQCVENIVSNLKPECRVPNTTGWWMKHGTLLVVDEISMLSLWTVTLASEVICALRNNHSVPFGGMQVVFFGDFYQLPPVPEHRSKCMICDADAAFDNDGLMICPRVAIRKSLPHPSTKTRCDEFHALPRTQFVFEPNGRRKSLMEDMRMVTMVLTEVVRQKDAKFISMLNRIRVGTLSQDDLESIKQRQCVPDDADGIIPTLLDTHRRNVRRENMIMYDKLPSKEHVFLARDTSYDKNKMCSTKNTRALSILLKTQPTCTDKLCLKVGCQVMFTANNPHKGYYNGTRGTVIEFSNAGNPVVKVFNPDKTYSTITVEQHKWSHTDGSIVATREQLPLTYAWAITIHKSQGLTLTKARVSLANVFEDGMVYVALSRMASIEGLYIESFDRSKISANKLVHDFYSRYTPHERPLKRLKVQQESVLA